MHDQLQHMTGLCQKLQNSGQSLVAGTLLYICGLATLFSMQLAMADLALRQWLLHLCK